MSDGAYTPSDWGKEFHLLDHDEALGAGAAGVGKTVVLVADPLEQILVEHDRVMDRHHPHRLSPGQSVGWALHLRRTMPMLKQSIERVSMKMYPQIDPKADWNQQAHTWTFSSGYKVQFGHCTERNSWQNYFSSEYTHIAFDELVQFEKEQYDQISGRARSSDPVLRNMIKVRSMSNPTVDRTQMENIALSDPMWVRKRFVDPAPQGRKTITKTVTLRSGEKRERRRIYLPGTLSDNPDKEFAENYEANLLDKPAHIRQALLYGNWYALVGSFYGEEWRNDLHTCEPFNIPDDWLRFRSLDWGFKSPGVVLWWAMDYDGNIFCEYELTFKGLTAKELANRIRQREMRAGLWHGGRSAITGPADNQIWEQRGATARSILSEMEEMGVGWVQADKKQRSRNAMLLLSRIRDHKNGAATPGIVFFNTCKKSITTIPTILAEDGDPETPMDGGDDHWHDATLYACAFASRGRLGIPTTRREGSAHYNEIELDQDMGQYGYGSSVC